MQVKGSIVATAAVTGTTTATMGALVFTVGNVVGGEPLDLNTTTPVMTVNYVDDSQFINDIPWTTDWIVTNDGDELLDSGELVEITVQLDGNLTNDLGINTQFSIEMKPPKGAALSMQRTTPPYFDAVIDLK
jgi:flagellin FlaB